MKAREALSMARRYMATFLGFSNGAWTRDLTLHHSSPFLSKGFSEIRNDAKILFKKQITQYSTLTQSAASYIEIQHERQESGVAIVATIFLFFFLVNV